MGFWGQKPSEILALMRILAAERPHAILEIGTAIGGTLFLLSRVADPYATLVSVDLPGGDFGGGYGREWTLVLQAMPRSTQTLHLVRSDSHDPATRARLAELLPIGTVDFLLIDGDHRYEGVRQDFEFYRPFVRPGGLVAFHDIVEGPEDLVGGAPAFWREMSPEHAKQELVAGAVPPHPLDAPFGDHGGFGIGLIRV